MVAPFPFSSSLLARSHVCLSHYVLVLFLSCSVESFVLFLDGMMSYREESCQRVIYKHDCRKNSPCTDCILMLFCPAMALDSSLFPKPDISTAATVVHSHPHDSTSQHPNDPLLLRRREFQRGAIWRYTFQWLTAGGNECNWYGVRCANSSASAAAITGIDLYGNYIAGTLSPDLGLLTSLVSFNMSRNMIGGTLSTTIGLCSSLAYFRMSDNRLENFLPSALGQWTVLTHFVVWANGLSGFIPSSIGQWTQLMRFEANICRFQGALPSYMGEWKHFNVNSNDLTGSLPSALGRWTKLKELFVGGNQLTGTIPESVGNWTSVSIVGLSTNQFTGSVPSSVGNWRNVTVVSLIENSFTGSNPIELCRTGGLVAAGCKVKVTCSCSHYCT